MNALQRALLEKAGNDHGFEYILSDEDETVNLASARHRARVRITLKDSAFMVTFSSPASGLLDKELVRSFPWVSRAETEFVVMGQDALTKILRRAAELAHALPNQANLDFDTKLKSELEKLAPELKGTEVERLVRQRIGQQSFRSAMLDYWGGACAVTGIAIPEVLRASHAKPWAECTSDAERLDVFNGFLLSANLDALFDRFLISFDEQGGMLISPSISPKDLERLAVSSQQSMRWLSPEHFPYLQYHRSRFENTKV